MSLITPNYAFATGVVADDFVEPDHHNRVADTVDRVLGEFLKHVIAAGAHEGWLLTEEAGVTPGQGLVGGCWCRTAQTGEVQGLQAGVVNHVYAAVDSHSAPEGTVAFHAQSSPPGPGGSVYLGTLEVDAEGEVVALDNDAPGVQRNCHRLAVERHRGQGVEAGMSAEETREVCVAHDAEGEFRLPGDLRVESDSAGFAWEITEHYRGDQFRFSVTNTGSETADFGYTWWREGLAR